LRSWCTFSSLVSISVSASARSGPQALALERDRVREGQPSADSGWRRPRVGIALDQHRIGGVEEQQLVVVAELGHRRQPLADPGQVSARLRTSMLTASLAARRLRRGHALYEGGQQFRRQVVDAVVAQVLERAQGDALAGAGHAADHDQGWSWRGVIGALTGGWWKAACACRARKAGGRSRPLARKHVQAHRGLGQHREVAAGGDRQLEHRHVEVEHAAGRRRLAGEPVHRLGLSAAFTRCTIRRRYLFFFTAVSPNICRMFITPRPRTSSMSCSISGQVPSSTSGAIWVNSGRVVGDQAMAARDQLQRQLALARAGSPVISTPMEKISMNTPCSEARGASASAMWYCSRLSSSKPRRGDTHSAVSIRRRRCAGRWGRPGSG
jgi:hypothetical protein